MERNSEMPKFFVKNEQIKDNEITILGEDVKHIANVLRLKKEDEIQICNLDTKMNYIANINEIDKKYVKCKIKKIENIKSYQGKILDSSDNLYNFANYKPQICIMNL